MTTHASVHPGRRVRAPRLRPRVPFTPSVAQRSGAKSRGRPDDLVVFLGPSLPAAEARALAPCRVLPPARQGDLFRALVRRPLAVALVDGLFESTPSIWHHEILAALDAGVAVFGGASMGALRAAELVDRGMVGVGRIFAWYREGVIQDDSEVALLHAGPEHAFRPLTVPLVNVRHEAERARAARILSAEEAQALVAAAAAIFYQERTWPRILASAERRWRPASRRRWEAWAAAGQESLKALDARACISAAAAFAAALRKAEAKPEHRMAAPAPARPTIPPPSSAVRRRRLREGLSLAPSGKEVPSSRVLDHLRRRPDAAALASRGLTRALLAGFARSLGLEPDPQAVALSESRWLQQLRVRPCDRAAFLAASGLDDGEARRLCEDLALEEMVLAHAERLVADGPSWEEGLAAQARVEGSWATSVADEASSPGRQRLRSPSA